MLPQSTAEFYRGQQRRIVATLALTRREWGRMGRDFDASWERVGPRLVLLAASAQLGAARAATDYVPAVLAETNQPDDPVGDVNPSAFAGIAADGRSLDGLLYGAVTTAKQSEAAGAPSAAESLAKGGAWLDMAAHTLVADAGRQSTGVGITARPFFGWVRMVNPPCCSRCAILAGKYFRFNQGFLRHPRCDCTHIPCREDRADDFTTDPQALVKSGKVTGLSGADKSALAEGADLNRVVNARRGGSGMTTTELARGGSARLTPEGIYARAKDRSEAVALLRRNGYLI